MLFFEPTAQKLKIGKNVNKFAWIDEILCTTCIYQLFSPEETQFMFVMKVKGKLLYLLGSYFVIRYCNVKQMDSRSREIHANSNHIGRYCSEH